MFEELNNERFWYSHYPNFDPSRRSPYNREQVFRKTNFLCAFCGEQPCESIDHLIPYSKGGRHNPENLLGACIDCNSAKADFLLEDFREKFFAGRGGKFYFETL